MDAERARRTLTAERGRLVELNRWSRERPDGPGVAPEGSVGQHPGDAGPAPDEFLDADALDDATARQVGEIDEALARVDDGSWGRCVVCGREIDDDRLEARPQAARCREHQDEFERAAG